MEIATEQKIDGRTREARALRPPMRSEDPRRDAAARAKQIMEHMTGEFGEQADVFYIPPNLVPDGWCWEWKEYLVFGKLDPAKQVEQSRTGWEPVSAARYPELMPGETNEPWVLRRGMRLMERPMEITEIARASEQRRANEQIQSKMEQLADAPPGTFERTSKAVSRRMERPMPVPD